MPTESKQCKIVVRDGLPFREIPNGELYSCTLLDCGAEIARLQAESEAWDKLSLVQLSQENERLRAMLERAALQFPNDDGWLHEAKALLWGDSAPAHEPPAQCDFIRSAVRCVLPKGHTGGCQHVKSSVDLCGRCRRPNSQHPFENCWGEQPQMTSEERLADENRAKQSIQEDVERTENPLGRDP